MTMDPLIVRAGDTLVVCFTHQQTESEMDAFARRVEEVLPGVRVAVLEGVSSLAVFRPGAAEPSAIERGDRVE